MVVDVVSVTEMMAVESGSVTSRGKSRFSAKFRVQPGKNCGRGNMGALSSMTW
jgi:hypothetical protein